MGSCQGCAGLNRACPLTEFPVSLVDLESWRFYTGNQGISSEYVLTEVNGAPVFSHSAASQAGSSLVAGEFSSADQVSGTDAEIANVSSLSNVDEMMALQFPVNVPLINHENDPSAVNDAASIPTDVPFANVRTASLFDSFQPSSTETHFTSQQVDAPLEITVPMFPYFPNQDNNQYYHAGQFPARQFPAAAPVNTFAPENAYNDAYGTSSDRLVPSNTYTHSAHQGFNGINEEYNQYPPS